MTSRELVIDEYFINITLNPKSVDLYYVRKSILNSLENNIHKFKGNILDIGCGIMPYRELILNRNKNVTKYIGLDFQNALEEEYALGEPDIFWKGDIIPMECNSVETVIATEFFEHCPEPEKVMKEILRVLKPGGIIFFTVPFLWNLHLVPYDEYRYTPFSLNRHLTNSGFVNIEMAALGSWDASLAQMIAIWFQQRPMRKRIKKLLSYSVLFIIRKLIASDAKVDKTSLFKEGSMITGICGSAYKQA